MGTRHLHMVPDVEPYAADEEPLAEWEHQLLMDEWRRATFHPIFISPAPREEHR